MPAGALKASASAPMFSAAARPRSASGSRSLAATTSALQRSLLSRSGGLTIATTAGSPAHVSPAVLRAREAAGGAPTAALSPFAPIGAPRPTWTAEAGATFATEQQLQQQRHQQQQQAHPMALSSSKPSSPLIPRGGSPTHKQQRTAPAESSPKKGGKKANSTAPTVSSAGWDVTPQQRSDQSFRVALWALEAMARQRLIIEEALLREADFTAHLPAFREVSARLDADFKAVRDRDAARARDAQLAAAPAETARKISPPRGTTRAARRSTALGGGR
jgi:hypothetical protein